MFDQTVVTITIQRLCFVHVKTIYIITKYLCVIHVLLYKVVMWYLINVNYQNLGNVVFYIIRNAFDITNISLVDTIYNAQTIYTEMKLSVHVYLIDIIFNR